MFYIGKGDLEPDMLLQVTVNDEPAVLTDVTSPLLIWTKPDGTTSSVALVAEDLALGKFKRVWVAGDTDQTRVHRALLRVTRGNGEQQTFPPDGRYYRWFVGETDWITWKDVVAFAPLLSTVDDEAQIDIIDYVNNGLNVATFGGLGDPMLRMARIFFAAHLGSMPQQSGTGAVGPVTSESAGGLSRSYAQVTSGDTSLSSTTYGQQFLEICRRSPVRAGDLL